MISFCTPLKGRLEYLKQTYVGNLLAARESGVPAEFILVDYDSRDGLAEWATTTLAPFADLVTLYRLTEPREQYYIPVADNCAMKLAKGDIVSNLMADIRVTPTYFREVYQLASSDRNSFVRPTREARTGTTGLLTLWKANFLAMGGYDEQMKGWGYQDVDLRHRAEARKMKLLYWTPEHAEALPHGDELRIKFAASTVAPSETNADNKERSRKNVKAKRLVANVGQEWGVAPVQRVPLV